MANKTLQEPTGVRYTPPPAQGEVPPYKAGQTPPAYTTFRSDGVPPPLSSKVLESP